MAGMGQILSPRTVRVAAVCTALFAVCVIGSFMVDPGQRALIWLCAAGAGLANFATMFLIGRDVLANSRPDAPSDKNTRLAALVRGEVEDHTISRR